VLSQALTLPLASSPLLSHRFGLARIRSAAPGAESLFLATRSSQAGSLHPCWVLGRCCCSIASLRRSAYAI